MDTTVQLATDLMGTTRRQIEAYARERGITPLHLTHYSKRILAAYVARESVRVTGGEPASQAAVEAALRDTKAVKAPYRPHVRMTTVYGVYRIESESQPGTFHTVDGVLGTCECTAAQWGRDCKHGRLAVATWEWHYRLRSLARRRMEAAGAFPVAA